MATDSFTMGICKISSSSGTGIYNGSRHGMGYMYHHTVPGDGNPQNQKPLMLNITTISFPIGTKRKKAHDSKPVGRPHRAIFEWIRAIQATNSSVTKQGNGGSKRGPYLQWQAFHQRLVRKCETKWWLSSLTLMLSNQWSFTKI